MVSKPHIAVCVCTYKRPELLERVLTDLGRQVTEGRFTYSIVVADNDQVESARSLVAEFAKKLPVGIKYCVEPRQNIALARNRAVENAAGDYIGFLDDDEFPTERWLLTLLNTCCQYEVDGVLGTAKPLFEGVPPSWVVKGKFYERATYPTGYVIDWRKGRTGNTLLKAHLFRSSEPAFRSDFLTGEDHDFFRRKIEEGNVFVWCDEAVTREIIPPGRWTRSFMLRRALFRGKISLIHPTSGAADVLKSLVAVPSYAVALPFMFVAGQHLFMKYLVKTCDHAGRLLAACGVNPIKDKYVTG
jgi:glycosyltransferase involved in cell wall biosynthesis